MGKQRIWRRKNNSSKALKLRCSSLHWLHSLWTLMPFELFRINCTNKQLGLPDDRAVQIGQHDQYLLLKKTWVKLIQISIFVSMTLAGNDAWLRHFELFLVIPFSGFQAYYVGGTADSWNWEEDLYLLIWLQKTKWGETGCRVNAHLLLAIF